MFPLPISKTLFGSDVEAEAIVKTKLVWEDLKRRVFKAEISCFSYGLTTCKPKNAWTSSLSSLVMFEE